MNSCFSRYGLQRRRKRWPHLPFSLYRLPEAGVVAGVCAGIAQHLQLSRNGVRILFVLAAFVSGFFPILAVYGVLYFILPVRYLNPRQEWPSSTEEEVRSHSFANSYHWNEPKLRRREMAARLQRLDKRAAELESYLISSEYEWERQYRDLSKHQ